MSPAFNPSKKPRPWSDYVEEGERPTIPPTLFFSRLFAAFVFLGTSTTGCLVWVLSFSLTRQVEPWDSEIYACVLIPTFVCGFINPRKPVWTAFYSVMGLWAGQLAAVLLFPQFAALRPTILQGVFSTLLGSIFGAAGVFLGRGARLLVVGFPKRPRLIEDNPGDGFD